MKKYINQPLYKITVFFLTIILVTPGMTYGQYLEFSGPTTGEYSSNQSITLLPGFSTSGPFRAFITRDLIAKLGSAPSQDQNYVITNTFKKAGVVDLTNAMISEVSQHIQYFDGLGRPLQAVQTKGSPLGNDIVQPIIYDAFGRESMKYLPYATKAGNGAYKTDALSTQSKFYSAAGYDDMVMKTAAPFSQTIFETSPLDRIIEQGSPGTVWQPASQRSNTAGRSQVTGYGRNEVNTVRFWSAESVTGTDYKRSLSNNGYYAEGQLFLKTQKDENWTSGDGKVGTTEEYIDKDGNTVLKRVFNRNGENIEILSTYYVFDDLGNLSYVLPPASNPDGPVIDQLTLDLYCYQYRYDERKRIIEKRIPAMSGWIEMVYNKLDQLVFTQDPVQQKSQKRNFLKYDALGRVIMTGIQNNSVSTRLVLQGQVNNQSRDWESRNAAGIQGYSNVAIPSLAESVEPEMINYYDDYTIPGIPGNESAGYTKKMQGLLTAVKVKVLGTNDFLWTVNYYDDEGRIVKQNKQHYLSGSVKTDNYDEISNSYNFEGGLVASTRIHHVGTAKTTIANRYVYDHMGRKVKNYEKINADDEVLLAENLYNEIGQLKTKELNNGDQKTNYTYNERGWLKSSKSDQFSQQLKYQDGTNPQFNGNISDQLWGAGNTLANNFVYTYDKLNRLSSGVGPGMSEAMSYDLMGNIQSLKRDNITRNYTYNGNRLNQITGGTEKSAYAYDDNGNAIVDGKNGQAISYNNLNLPVKIAGLDLSYVYDAAGNKLKKIKGGLVTDYIEGIQYTAGVIEFIQTETGLARRKDNSYGYEYNLTDNLGNVRYSFYKNPVTNKIERLQSDDYYPFGLRKSSGNTVSLNNKYLYNGKELQDELGQYDYGARFYDPVIGRWNVLDAKSELYFQITPYAYAANTPTNAIDPNGHIVIFINGNFYDGTGGSPKYWRGFTVGSNYDDTKSYHPWFFDKAVMNRFKDHNESLKGTSFNAYIDGSLGGHAPNNGNLKLQNRIDAGYEQGQQDAAVLINSLARTNGVITESLKIVTHSMGAAFGKGYIKAIIEYAKAHPKLARGLSITEYDFAAFQQNKLSAIPGVPLFQFDNIGDDVVSGAIGYSNGSWHAKQSGREENGSNDNVLSYGGHDIGDFMRAVSTLSVGTYKFINGKFVRQ